MGSQVAVTVVRLPRDLLGVGELEGVVVVEVWFVGLREVESDLDDGGSDRRSLVAGISVAEEPPGPPRDGMLAVSSAGRSRDESELDGSRLSTSRLFLPRLSGVVSRLEASLGVAPIGRKPTRAGLALSIPDLF
nr:TPA_asm: m18.5 ORF [Murid betaherpesvirus 1]DBA07731.1 TPA_asm: m18.5 ORF [Murid betaherpesvirus 1]